MALSRLVEFIQSLGFMGGGLGIDPTVQQVGFTGAVPNTIAAGGQQTWRLNAGGQPYATIVHKVSFGAAIVPNVFTAEIIQAGHFAYTPAISATVIRDGVELFAISTTAIPLTIRVTNSSLLAQAYEHIVYGTDIATREDYDKVMWALKELARVNSQQLVTRAVMALEHGRR